MEATTLTPSDDGTLVDMSTGELVEDQVDEESPEGVDPDLWNRWKDADLLKKDQFLYQLQQGRLGNNIGLENGLQYINKYIYGTHKARYYLVGADSGVGKTTIADFMYVLNAWLSAKKQNRPIKIYYCSFEIGKTEKLFRWCSYFIFIKYGVRLSADYLQGRITGKLLSDQHTMWALEAYSTITEMLKDITIIQDVVHPTKIFENLIEIHFEKHGTVERSPVSPEDARKGKKGFVKGYTENDPRMITMLMVDHLALTGTEMHLETKGIMDKMSKYMIVLRNLFYCTGCFIQQFSTDMMSTYRSAYGKSGEASITPQRIDFGDSKATYRDADVVFGGAKPQSQMEEFMGYNLSKQDGLGDCFIAWYIMKNRYGTANRLIPLFMDGISGMIYDLPLEPHNPLVMQQWYERAQNIELQCQSFSQLPK